jgi:LPXTG-site transpeptidase (sortase) family protein
LNNGLNDTQINFTVLTIGGGGGGGDGGGGTTPTDMPDTGFPVGKVTPLPEQSPADAYTSYGDLWLEIPRLGVKASIVGVPQKNGSWDVSWLWDQAGYLEGSAFPTGSGNSVLTSHVYLSDGKPGPFVSLHTLTWGDQIIIHAYGQQYVYEVRSATQVLPTAVGKMMKHEEQSWLTLVTCRGYNESTDDYQYRVLIRAVLVKTK